MSEPATHSTEPGPSDRRLSTLDACRAVGRGPWHTPCMRLLALFRLRVRMSIDTLVTLALMAGMAALVIGYQVMRFRYRAGQREVR